MQRPVKLQDALYEFHKENEEVRQWRLRAFRVALEGDAEALNEAVARYESNKELFNRLFDGKSAVECAVGNLGQPAEEVKTTLTRLAAGSDVQTRHEQEQAIDEAKGERGANLTQSKDRAQSIGGRDGIAISKLLDEYRSNRSSYLEFLSEPRRPGCRRVEQPGGGKPLPTGEPINL